MSKIKRRPAIPNIPAKLPPEFRPFFNAVRENLQVLGGEGRGNPLDEAVTKRDLENGTFSTLINRQVKTGGSGTQPSELPIPPTSFSISADTKSIRIAWDRPIYVGHKHTNVYIVSHPRGTTDNARVVPFAEAELYISASGQSAVILAQEYQWVTVFIAHENGDGVVGDEAGPLQAQALQGDIVDATVPTGVELEVVEAGVVITWDLPIYAGHARSKIYVDFVGIDSDGDPLRLGNYGARILFWEGKTNGTRLALPEGTGAYFWVVHENEYDVESPPHDILGIYGYVERYAETPTKPVGVVLTSVAGGIVVRWSPTSYVGHRFANIYVQTDLPNPDGSAGAPPNLNQATMLAQTVTGNLTTVYLQPEMGAYIWVSNENILGEESAVHAVAGSYGVSLLGVGTLLDQIREGIDKTLFDTDLFDLITEAEGFGFSNQNSRITDSLERANAADAKGQAAIDDIDNRVNGALGALDFNINGIATDLSINYYTSVDADSAMQQETQTQITALNIGDYTKLAFIEQEYRTEVDSDSAMATAVQVLRAEVTTAEYESQANISSNYSTTVEANEATAGLIETFNSEVLQANYKSSADITVDHYTKAGANAATAGLINTFNSEVLQAGYKTSADIESEYYTSAQANAAISGSLETFSAKIFDADGSTVKEAFISEVRISSTDLNVAVAAGIDSYELGYGDDTYSLDNITQIAVDNEGIYAAQWGVQLSVGDLTRGVGFLATNADEGIDDSLFYINAQNFVVGDPDSTDTFYPFTVTDGVTYISDAVIRDARIEELVVDTVTTSRDLVITDSAIIGGVLSAASINVDSDGTWNESYNFSVNAAGNLRARDGNFAGQISSSDIVGGTFRTSSSFAPDSTSRVVISALGTYKMWCGTGAQTDDNALFYLKSNGDGAFNGSLNVRNLEGDVYDASLISIPSKTFIGNDASLVVYEAILDGNSDFDRAFYTNVTIGHSNGGGNNSNITVSLWIDGVQRASMLSNPETLYENEEALSIGCNIPQGSADVTVELKATTDSNSYGYVNRQFIHASVFKVGNQFMSVSVDPNG